MNIKRIKKMFNRHLHFFRPGLNTLLLNTQQHDGRYLLKRDIKLKYIIKLAYIEGHRIFGVCQIEPVISQ